MSNRVQKVAHTFADSHSGRPLTFIKTKTQQKLPAISRVFHQGILQQLLQALQVCQQNNV